ncbi:hypothetical protein GCM10027085_30150 [Spirosoma aerophilum]
MKPSKTIKGVNIAQDINPLAPHKGNKNKQTTATTAVNGLKADLY